MEENKKKPSTISNDKVKEQGDLDDFIFAEQDNKTCSEK